MKIFKEAYKNIFHYYNEHGSHNNSFYISNMHWIYSIPNQSFINTSFKLVEFFKVTDIITTEHSRWVSKNSFSWNDRIGMGPALFMRFYTSAPGVCLAPKTKKKFPTYSWEIPGRHATHTIVLAVITVS